MPDVLLLCYPVCDLHVTLAGPLPIEAGTTTPADRVSLTPGGLATTVFVAARLGVNIEHLGVVGRDDVGDLLVRGYEREGVSTAGLERSEGFATQAVVVLADPGREHAYASMLEGRFPAQAFDRLEQARLLVISGYMLADPEVRQETLRLAASARSRGLRVVLDPGPLAHPPDIQQRALATTDVLLLNDTEALAWSGAPSIESAAAALSDLMPPAALVVVKTGGRGCYADGRWHPGFRVPVVDTVGAGDAFLGGFLRGYLDQRDLGETLAMANAAGAATAGKRGAGANAATRSEILRLL